MKQKYTVEYGEPEKVGMSNRKFIFYIIMALVVIGYGIARPAHAGLSFNTVLNNTINARAVYVCDKLAKSAYLGKCITVTTDEYHYAVSAGLMDNSKGLSPNGEGYAASLFEDCDVELCKRVQQDVEYFYRVGYGMTMK